MSENIRYKVFNKQEVVTPNGTIIYDDEIVDRLATLKSAINKVKDNFDKLSADLKSIEGKCNNNANVGELTRIRTKLESIVAELNSEYNKIVNSVGDRVTNMIANNEKTVADTQYIMQKLQGLRN